MKTNSTQDLLNTRICRLAMCKTSVIKDIIVWEITKILSTKTNSETPQTIFMNFRIDHPYKYTVSAVSGIKMLRALQRAGRFVSHLKSPTSLGVVYIFRLSNIVRWNFCCECICGQCIFQFKTRKSSTKTLKSVY